MVKKIFILSLLLSFSNACLAKNVSIYDLQHQLKGTNYTFYNEQAQYKAKNPIGNVDFRLDDNGNIGAIILDLNLDYKDTNSVQENTTVLFKPFITDEVIFQKWLSTCLKDMNNEQKVIIGDTEFACLSVFGGDFYLSAYKKTYQDCLDKNEKDCKETIKD